MNENLLGLINSNLYGNDIINRHFGKPDLKHMETENSHYYYRKLDNIIYTSKKFSKKRRDIKYFSDQTQVYQDQEKTICYNDVEIGSVRALSRKKVKKVYLPDTEENSCGISNFSSNSFKITEQQNSPWSFRMSKITLSKCAGCTTKGYVVDEKLSLIMQTLETVSRVTDNISRDRQKSNNTHTGTKSSSILIKIDEINFRDKPIEQQSGKIGQYNETLRVKQTSLGEKDKCEIVDSNKTTYTKMSPSNANKSNEKYSKYYKNTFDNKSETEHKKLLLLKQKEFTKKTGGKKSLSEHITPSVQSRLRAILPNLGMKESKKSFVIDKKFAGQIEINIPNSAIDSHSGPLEPQSYSNTKRYSLETLDIKQNRLKKIKKDLCVSCSKKSVTTKSQTVKPKIKFWVKRINRVESNYTINGGRKAFYDVTIKNVKKGGTLEITEVDRNEKDKKKLFSFSKWNKYKERNKQKAIKCNASSHSEISDELTINLKVRDLSKASMKQKETFDEYKENVRRVSPQEPITHSTEPRNPIKVNWNKKISSIVSDTVFEMFHNINKHIDIVYRSKSDFTFYSSHKTYDRLPIEACLMTKMGIFHAHELNKLNKEIMISITPDKNKIVDIISSKMEFILQSPKGVKCIKQESTEYSNINISKEISDTGEIKHKNNYSRQHALSEEDLHKITIYEGTDLKQVKPGSELNKRDYKQNNIKVTISVNSNNNIEKIILEKAKLPTMCHDVVVQSSYGFISRNSDSVGTSMFDEKEEEGGSSEISMLNFNLLYDGLSTATSDRSIMRYGYKRCQLAESYLQEYYRQSTSLGIDSFSWCVSDCHLQYSSCSSKKSCHSQHETKSCPNIFDDVPKVKFYVARISNPRTWFGKLIQKLFTKIKKETKSDKNEDISDDNKLLPKDSIEVFHGRKHYATTNKAKWNVGARTKHSCSLGTKNNEDCSTKDKNCYKQINKTCDGKHVSLFGCKSKCESRINCGQKPEGVLTFKSQTSITCKKKILKTAIIAPSDEPISNSCEEVKGKGSRLSTNSVSPPCSTTSDTLLSCSPQPSDPLPCPECPSCSTNQEYKECNKSLPCKKSAPCEKLTTSSKKSITCENPIPSEKCGTCEKPIPSKKLTTCEKRKKSTMCKKPIPSEESTSRENHTPCKKSTKCEKPSGQSTTCEKPTPCKKSTTCKKSAPSEKSKSCENHTSCKKSTIYEKLTHSKQSTNCEKPAPGKNSTMCKKLTHSEQSTTCEKPVPGKNSTMCEKLIPSEQSTMCEKPTPCKKSTVYKKPIPNEKSTSCENYTPCKKSAIYEKLIPSDQATYENHKPSKKSTTCEKPTSCEKPTTCEKPAPSKNSTMCEKPTPCKKSTVCKKPIPSEISTSCENYTPCKKSAICEVIPSEEATTCEKPTSCEKPTTCEKPAPGKNSTMCEKLIRSEQSTICEKPTPCKKSAICEKLTPSEESTCENPRLSKMSTMCEKPTSCEKPTTCEMPTVCKQPPTTCEIQSDFPCDDTSIGLKAFDSELCSSRKERSLPDKLSLCDEEHLSMPCRRPSIFCPIPILCEKPSDQSSKSSNLLCKKSVDSPHKKALDSQCMPLNEPCTCQRKKPLETPRRRFFSSGLFCKKPTSCKAPLPVQPPTSCTAPLPVPPPTSCTAPLPVPPPTSCTAPLPVPPPTSCTVPLPVPPPTCSTKCNRYPCSLIYQGNKLIKRSREIEPRCYGSNSCSLGPEPQMCTTANKAVLPILHPLLNSHTCIHNGHDEDGDTLSSTCKNKSPIKKEEVRETCPICAYSASPPVADPHIRTSTSPFKASKYLSTNTYNESHGQVCITADKAVLPSVHSLPSSHVRTHNGDDEDRDTLSSTSKNKSPIKKEVRETCPICAYSASPPSVPAHHTRTSTSPFRASKYSSTNTYNESYGQVCTTADKAVLPSVHSLLNSQTLTNNGNEDDRDTLSSTSKNKSPIKKEEVREICPICAYSALPPSVPAPNARNSKSPFKASKYSSTNTYNESDGQIYTTANKAVLPIVYPLPKEAVQFDRHHYQEPEAFCQTNPGDICMQHYHNQGTSTDSPSIYEPFPRSTFCKVNNVDNVTSTTSLVIDCFFKAEQDCNQYRNKDIMKAKLSCESVPSTSGFKLVQIGGQANKNMSSSTAESNSCFNTPQSVTPSRSPPIVPYIVGKSKVTGIHVKVIPSSKRTYCPSNCPTWRSFKQNDCLILNSEEKIVIRLSDKPSSIKDYNENVNIKVQDEKGITLYERKDCRQNYSSSKSNGLLGDIYKHSHVQRLATHLPCHVTAADCDRYCSHEHLEGQNCNAAVIKMPSKLKVSKSHNTKEKKTESKVACNSNVTNKAIYQDFQGNAKVCSEEKENAKKHTHIRMSSRKLKSEQRNKIFANRSNYENFSNKISAKFLSVFPDYSDTVPNDTDQILFIHKYTLDFTNSLEELEPHSRQCIQNPSQEMSQAKKDADIVLPSRNIKSACQWILEDVSSKVENKEMQSLDRKSNKTQHNTHKNNITEKKNLESEKRETNTVKSKADTTRKEENQREIHTNKRCELKYRPVTTADTELLDTSLEICSSIIGYGETRKVKNEITYEETYTKSQRHIYREHVSNIQRIEQHDNIFNVILPPANKESGEVKTGTKHISNFCQTIFLKNISSMNNLYLTESSSHVVISGENINKSVNYLHQESNICSSFKNVTYNNTPSHLFCLYRAVIKKPNLVSWLCSTDGVCHYINPQTKTKRTICCDLVRSDHENIDKELIDAETQYPINLNEKTDLRIFSRCNKYVDAIDNNYVKNMQRSHNHRNIDDKHKIILLSNKSKKITTEMKGINRDQKCVVNVSDILQSNETKRAVIEIYTEKTVSEGNKRLIDKLPKFVYETEIELHNNYKAIATNVSINTTNV